MKWWQTAVFYQIYPRSFADGNGDGIGDFPGMIQKLDYLQALGIDAVWLSPHFPSPMFDCGYDISDYTGVAPEYGTLDDFQHFLDEAHSRGMYVILDLVLNHTSDQHPWFIESRSNRTNPKRDWYIWKDGKNGGPPNDWCSCFDGAAWEYDEETSQYYYHYFFKQQPDLNWRNPAVKQAMFDAARFWLRMGVDGFRLDAIGTIFERPDLRNHNTGFNLASLRDLERRSTTPEERRQFVRQWIRTFHHQFGQPGLHELMKELRSVLNEFPGDRMLVGEDADVAYLGNGHDELNMVFNFPLMDAVPLTPASVRKNQKNRLALLAPVNGWPCNTLGNHDAGHFIARFNPTEAPALARLHTAVLLTLRGTPFIYNGDEIGMTHLTISNVSDFRDLLGSWVYNEDIQQLHMTHDQALAHAAETTRDKGRTPMQWANTSNGGFCPPSASPWLPVNPNYAQGINVADQDPDPSSLLNFHRRLLTLRRQVPALIEGEFTALLPRSRYLLAYLRKNASQTVLVVLNFSDVPRIFAWKSTGPSKYNNLHTLYSASGISNSKSAIRLAPFDIFIGELQ